ncbi:MATE family efflux transporter [Alloiococcus sp. CFN-8]|uniref:MATE family efflux transporter n=1 Tax=Alloiococcus sp. CFN-8 TaxID=3416081 RepID=UPI003CF681F0
MDTVKRRFLILDGNIYRVIFILALPIMVNNLIQTAYNLVDGLWVSRLGPTEFAATSFVWPVNFLFISLGLGISIAGTAIISQLIGAEKMKEAGEYAVQMIAISFIAAIVFAVIGYISSPFVIAAMGGKGELAFYSNIYLRITFLDMPFMFLFFNYNSIMQAQGNTLYPTVLSGISAILNCVLDPIFIFNLNMGVAGAAWATLISKALLAMAGLFMLYKKSGIVKVSFRGFRFNKEIGKKIISIAVPSSLGQSGSALGFIILNSFVASYGTATLAAFGMVNRITSLIMQPASGIGSALTSIVGQNLGAEQFSRVKEAVKKSTISVLAISLLGLAAMLIWDREIIEFFMQSGDDGGVVQEGITFLQFIAYSAPLMGIFSIFQGIFQGSGHTKYSMAMDVGRLWLIRIPMILIFKYFTSIGSEGIWFSMSFSNLITCIYGFIIYRQNKWQVRVVK